MSLAVTSLLLDIGGPVGAGVLSGAIVKGTYGRYVTKRVQHQEAQREQQERLKFLSETADSLNDMDREWFASQGVSLQALLGLEDVISLEEALIKRANELVNPEEGALEPAAVEATMEQVEKANRRFWRRKKAPREEPDWVERLARGEIEEAVQYGELQKGTSKLVLVRPEPGVGLFASKKPETSEVAKRLEEDFALKVKGLREQAEEIQKLEQEKAKLNITHQVVAGRVVPISTQKTPSRVVVSQTYSSMDKNQPRVEYKEAPRRNPTLNPDPNISNHAPLEYTLEPKIVKESSGGFTPPQAINYGDDEDSFLGGSTEVNSLGHSTFCNCASCHTRQLLQPKPKPKPEVKAYSDHNDEYRQRMAEEIIAHNRAIEQSMESVAEADQEALDVAMAQAYNELCDRGLPIPGALQKYISESPNVKVNPSQMPSYSLHEDEGLTW